MARRAKNAKCSEEDIRVLDEMINSPQSVEYMVIRAKIILLSNEGKQNKEIASMLNTNPNLVGKWISRFNLEGLKGLSDLPRSGRAKNELDPDLLARIEELIKSPPPNGRESWTVEDVAKELTVSSYAIQNIIRNSPLVLGRKRLWAYEIDDGLGPKSGDVVGLFSSVHEKAIVIGFSTDALLEGKCRFRTRNRALATDIEAMLEGESHPSLSRFLNLATDHAKDKKKFPKEDLGNYLNELVMDIPGRRDTDYALLVYSPTFVMSGSLYQSGVFINIVRDEDAWRQKATDLLSKHCEPTEVGELRKSFERYLSACTQSTETFLWKKQVVLEGKEPQTSAQVQEAPGKGTGSGKAPSLQLKATYFVGGKKGFEATVEVKDGLLPPEDCNLEDRESVSEYVENLVQSAKPAMECLGQMIGQFATGFVKMRG